MQERRNSKWKRHQSTFAQRSAESKESMKFEHLHPNRNFETGLTEKGPHKPYLSNFQLKETLDGEDD